MPLLGRMNRDKVLRFHDEISVDNFSAIDCDLTFYSFVRSLYHRYPIRRVLDYGAGRNRYAQDFNPEIDSCLIRDLRDLRFGGSEVTAVDLNPEVLDHPTSNRQHVLEGQADRLPSEDGYFDLVVSDYVFEHVEHPEAVAKELQRVLKPGGWLAVRTPNRFGYLKVASSLVPNRLHNAVLKFVQPHRKAIDTFPTYYRLNSRAAIERHFDECRVSSVTDSWEPAYFFGKPWLYRLFLLIHKLLPRKMGTATIFLMQKKD